MTFWGEQLIERRNKAIECNIRINDSLEVMLGELEERTQSDHYPVHVELTKEGDVFDAIWIISIGGTDISITAKEVEDHSHDIGYDEDTGEPIRPEKDIKITLGELITNKYLLG